MELWIIYALLGMIISGVYVFIQKIFAERKCSVLEVIYFISFGQILGGLIGWAFDGFSLVDWRSMVAWSALSGFLYLLVDGLRIKSLTYIDTAIFFPIYKALGPAMVTLAGVFIFFENLSRLELLGIVLGITVPLMLIHRSEKGRQKDLRMGLYFLLASVVVTSMGAITLKFAADNDASPFLFVVVASVVATILAYIQKSLVLRKQSVEDAAEHKRTNASAKRLAFGLGVVNALGIFFIFKATEVSLSISYTINSFYILIPIILSMIIYKEHMNLRKGVAIVLSLLAIIFFQI